MEDIKNIEETIVGITKPALDEQVKKLEAALGKRVHVAVAVIVLEPDANATEGNANATHMLTLNTFATEPSCCVYVAHAWMEQAFRAQEGGNVKH